MSARTWRLPMLPLTALWLDRLSARRGRHRAPDHVSARVLHLEHRVDGRELSARRIKRQAIQSRTEVVRRWNATAGRCSGGYRSGLLHETGQRVDRLRDLRVDRRV